MEKYFLLAALLVASVSASAGSSSYVCKNQSGTVIMDAMAAGLDGIINIYYERNGKKHHYRGDVAIKPGYAKDTPPENFLLALPTTNIKKVSEKCERMHVIQADGTECYGREAWNIVTEVNYLISASNGNAVFTDDKLGAGSQVEGKTEQGYIHDRFSCLDAGVTTAGGCFAEQDSQLIEWVEIPCN
ncbi:hypothetical protein AZI85_15605 [Bdellovibrio bacteriovorus]|uniref:Uncharacterized protein n=1 Tax=Bdellovibrio bacteriovorus TaxID=959 RepID=A0A150WUF0_BDEBC|nr:hypothetical protein [Bdellovibrio bacteriovorus]KYG70109.1 hypothetical protein AZI85_15605 [Bdellovibrio bacteriovorus]